LVVTDVFGERTLVFAADEGADNDWQRWSMFNLSNKNEIGNYNRQFFLPATLASTLESEPLEQVNYQRARWYGGRSYVWIGRYRETGRGEGSSELRFDQIEPVNP
jgi:hypothetical protein